ncbi:hypothetical protein CGCA056_v012912 [Colletotrichum aenigma]|uniref:uncharacterized protein n=1 Tax=Colletotrichum aenigma TaxID=1215731 RepID=UPI001872FCDA|nr:uncharacterized protein CGCA056_v012912 [Colletotrichum aenigma]KAF5507044.1 hypothetical protein CGCA056_v012912 [Colletotrichum aenigma]
MPKNKPPPHSQMAQPRMSVYRYFVRLRDRLEFILVRYVDKDPHVQKDFPIYKAERDEKWAVEDGFHKQIPLTKSTTELETIKSCVKQRCAEASPASPESPKKATPDTGDKGKKKDAELFSGFDFGLGDASPSGQRKNSHNGSQHAAKDKGLAIERQNTHESRPRDVSRSNTFTSVVDSTLSESRRRKRQRSDSKPGYFDPDPFHGDVSAAGTAGIQGEGDELVMNVPVELRNGPMARGGHDVKATTGVEGKGDEGLVMNIPLELQNRG